MNFTKYFETFFRSNEFYLLDYTNVVAHFRTEEVEEGFLCYYDIICTIHDDFLEEFEELPFNESYNIKDIYCRADYVSEINQHDVFSVKSDILFSNVQNQNEKEI